MKFVLALVAASCVMAQTPYSTSIAAATVPEEIAINRGSAALWQSLKKLHTRASLVMVRILTMKTAEYSLTSFVGSAHGLLF